MRSVFLFCYGGAFRNFGDRIAYKRRGTGLAALELVPAREAGLSSPTG
ncbi:hypothetical protein [Methylobacterium trifolii]|nr:hypothetical protein [Methylobacterium trifolii]